MEDSQEARTWWKQWIGVEKLIFPVLVTQKEQLSGVLISDFEKSAFMRHPTERGCILKYQISMTTFYREVKDKDKMLK